MTENACRLPLALWGRRELLLYGAFPLTLAALLLGLGGRWAPWGLAPGLAGLAVCWFFRDPRRRIPAGSGLYVSPADGRVVEVESVPDYGFLGGPAVRIGIFLSVLDVHLNRAPADARVVGKQYRPGKHRDARNPLSQQENESQWIGFEEPNGARFAVRQVSGAVARRLVCAVVEGDFLERGQRLGMIKFGSRTELVLPLGVGVKVKVGDRVKAGETVLAVR
ncbi:MAG: phosphatidylserine decarboxylase family protein [Planctomycetales bacterium]|nr:phosphatidylserine decarboxylase family protein [Planctomycetales bacterium]